MTLFLKSDARFPSVASIVYIDESAHSDANGAPLRTFPQPPILGPVSALSIVGQYGWKTVPTALVKARDRQGLDTAQITKIVYQASGGLRLFPFRKGSGLDDLIEKNCEVLQAIAQFCPNARVISRHEDPQEVEFLKRPTLSQALAQITEERLGYKERRECLKGKGRFARAIPTAQEAGVPQAAAAERSEPETAASSSARVLNPSEVIAVVAEVQPANAPKSRGADALRKRNLALARGEQS